MSPPPPLRFYEFFAGAGMAGLGLGPDWDSIWANDIDPSKVELYAHNYGSAHLDSRDVALVADDVKAGRLDATAEHPAFPLGADMAWASFPCQDLSLAGWQRGMSARRSGTYWHFHEIMEALERRNARPPLVVIENVQGLLYGDSFNGLCESLTLLGMRFGAVLVDAKHFIAQSRPRVFVIATDAALPTAAFERDGPADWHARPVVAAYESLAPDLQKRWAWWGLPPSTTTPADAGAVFESAPSDIDYHPPAETERIIGMMNEHHRAKVDEARSQGDLKVGFLYKRTRDGVQRAEVRFDGVAGCLRTPKGGSSRQTVVVVKGDQVRSRLLSRNEAARLMGIALDQQGRLPGKAAPFFPDGFGYNDAYRAMGDGVAVPVVGHLAEHLLTPLATLARAWRQEGAADPQLGLVDRDEGLAERVGTRIAAFAARAK